MESEKRSLISQIDCFHWEQQDADNYNLVYYDSQGQRHQRTLPKEILELSLKLFDGKTHLIKRSSGAYSPATPSQLLIYHDPNKAPSSVLDLTSLRISAKFIDLERNSEGIIISNKLVVYLKNVSPNTFRLLNDKEDPYKHQYWLDLGPTIVPITVFDFFRDEKEMINALFVKTEELKLISEQQRGQKAKITVYSAPEAVLRVSLPQEAEEVIEQHTLTRSISKPSTKVEIPTFLQFGPSQLIPTGAVMDVLTHYLRVCHDPHSLAIKQSFLTALEKAHNDTHSHLMPFGVFERA